MPHEEGNDMIRKYLPLYLVVLVVLSLAFIYGCGSNATGGGGGGGGISNRSGSFSYSGTQSPGDMWTWNISDETFSGSNETTGFYVTGEWTALSSKFGKAHVLSINGVATSEYTYFLEFPDTILLFRPFSNDNKDNVIVCAAHSTVEPSQGKYLWVTIPESGWTDAFTAYGTVEATGSGSGPWSFDVTNYLLTGEVSDNFTVSGYTFTNGVMDNGNYPTNPKLFMTPTGVFMGDNDTHSGFAGASYEAFDAGDAVKHNYRGVRFKYYSGSGTNETEVVAASPYNSTSLNAHRYISVDNNTLDLTDNTYITFEAQDLNTGFTNLYAYDENQGTTAIYKAVAAKVGPAPGKYMLFGFGVEAGLPTNFLVIQVD
jgi:hypothetical protein